ncbi:MAG: hypothetical protein KF725_14510 [Cyclobacteriaceae bacterium]|nr:hypothetical protein [Cyclobacteriaceae bacterium]UYN87430.1 MAG: hypothetical protein KIT51_03945 [Cyclobacteriaceae bacterium]
MIIYEKSNPPFLIRFVSKFIDQQVPLLLLVGILVMLSVLLKEASFVIGLYIAAGIVGILFIITTLGVWQKAADRLVLIELLNDTLHVQAQHYSSLVHKQIPLKQLSISVAVATENKKGWRSFELEIGDKSIKEQSLVAELDIYEIGPILEAIQSHKLKKPNKTEIDILELYNRSGSRPFNFKKWGIILGLGAVAVYLYLNKEMTLQYLKDFQVKPGPEIGAWRSDADGFPYYFQLNIDSTWEENYFDKTGKWKWVPEDTISHSSPQLHIFTTESFSYGFIVQQLTDNTFVLENPTNQRVYSFSRLKGGSFSKPNVTQRFVHFMNQSTLLPPDKKNLSDWLRALDIQDENFRPAQVFIQSDSLFAGLLTRQTDQKQFILGVDDFSQKKLFLMELSSTSGCNNSFSLLTEKGGAALKQEENCQSGKASTKAIIYQINKTGVQQVEE